MFAANPFASRHYDISLPRGDHELKAGERLQLRHRLRFNQGYDKAAGIAAAYEDYAT